MDSSSSSRPLPPAFSRTEMLSRPSPNTKMFGSIRKIMKNAKPLATRRCLQKHRSGKNKNTATIRRRRYITGPPAFSLRQVLRRQSPVKQQYRSLNEIMRAGPERPAFSRRDAPRRRSPLTEKYRSLNELMYGAGANSSSPPSSPKPPAFGRQEALRRRSPRTRKFRQLWEIMETTEEVAAPAPRDAYADVTCEICGSGDREEELLLCDGCDRGYHTDCLQPAAVVPIGAWYCSECNSDQLQSTPVVVHEMSSRSRKVLEFFGISNLAFRCITPQVARKIKRRKGLVLKRPSRRLLAYVPTADPQRRMEQMRSLHSALSVLNMKYSDELTYDLPGMAPRSANRSILESDDMQILSKQDTETLRACREMHRGGKCPPLMIVFDPLEGYTVEADDPIKYMTIIAEYIGDVDYIKNRENDECDSLMTLLKAKDEAEESLLICPDKRANIARFFNGINNHTEEGKKKQNVKCVRYSLNGECRVLLIAYRNIRKGERLYFNYNEDEDAYPTENFK